MIGNVRWASCLKSERQSDGQWIAGQVNVPNFRLGASGTCCSQSAVASTASVEGFSVLSASFVRNFKFDVRPLRSLKSQTVADANIVGSIRSPPSCVRRIVALACQLINRVVTSDQTCSNNTWRQLTRSFVDSRPRETVLQAGATNTAADHRKKRKRHHEVVGRPPKLSDWKESK